MDHIRQLGQLEITYRRHGNLGVVEIQGKRDVESARLFWRHLSKIIRVDGLTAMLVRDRAVDQLLAHQLIDMEQAMQDGGLPRQLPIAIVDEDATDAGNNAFGELVARNRGWVMVRLFRKEIEAWTWLNVPPADENRFAPVDGTTP